MFIVEFFIIAKTCKQSTCLSTDKWINKMWYIGASLVAQWLRVLLPMQGTQVWALVWEDPTCHRATKLVHHNYWACALEPASHDYWSPCATPTEAHMPRARALQQEKPPQWEAHCTTTKSSPHLPQLEKARAQQRRPNAAKNKTNKNKF